MRFAQALRFLRKGSVPHAAHEPADLGTAFGMEASLEGAEPPAYFQTSDYGLESEQRADATAATESPLAWLSGRRGGV